MTVLRPSVQDELPAQIRAARAYGDLDQAKVARHLGVSRATVSAWERGAHPIPPIARAGVIAGLRELTGLGPEFFGGNTNKKEEQ